MEAMKGVVYILDQILLYSDQIILFFNKNSSIGCKIYFRSDSLDQTPLSTKKLWKFYLL